MDELQPTNQNTISVEAEWKRVDKLLESKEDASWAMAVVEAFKIFRQVLDEVSFGETVEVKIRNAGELFRDVRGVLAAEKVCRHILADVGHRVTKTDASRAAAAFMQGILDMIGRDSQDRNWFDRWLTGLNYFWGTHPRLLAGMLGILVGLVLVTWFLVDTNIGHWAAGVLTGFTHFIVVRPWLAGVLLAALLISWLLGLAFSDRQQRP